MIAVQRDDARVHDGHTEFIKSRRRVRERAFASGRVEDGLDAVAGLAATHVDEADLGLRVGVRQPLGVPGDFLDPVPQEVVLIEQRPDGVDAILGDAAFEQDVARLLPGLREQLFAVDRVLEAAPEGTPCLEIQIAE